ncbi:hypothetical protein EYR26_12200 [Xanthomonas oryzae]|nr:hypothetical protein EYR26_12200 [Xanthomonas oryzae]QBH03734.1 hypothetical protein EYC57_10385 [Xanthomonas oryzae]
MIRMEIRIISAHGDYEVQLPSTNLTLAEICQLNRIPLSSAAFYSRRHDTGEVAPFADTLAKISELEQRFSQIVIRPDRNIDYNKVMPAAMETDVSPQDVTSYLFKSVSSEEAKVIQKGFTAKECREYVDKQVARVVDRHQDIMRDAPIVVGISGGGDSNALLGALIAAGIAKENIRAVMIMGVPDWDKGRSRAQALCESYGIELRVYEADEVSAVLGLRPGKDWVSGFEKTYPGVDVEVIGTLAIRRVLAAEVARLGGNTIVTGLNLEDLLADALMRVLEGKLPLPFPKRVVDGISIVYPLYMCPKRILDGCFPKYSLENYEDRYPSHLDGRAIAYVLAQSMNPLMAGIEFDLLRGLERLSEQWNSDELAFNPGIGFATIGNVSLEDQAKWRQYQIGQ